jgi:hypothetical protein
MNASDDKERIETLFRVPVAEQYCGRYFIATLAPESLLPSDEELAILRSIIEFKISITYNETYIRKLMAMALPREAGHNTSTYTKGLHGDETKGWFYGKSTWTGAPRWPNPVAASFKPLTLVEVVEHEYRGIGGVEPAQDWLAWKQTHPAFRPPLAPVAPGPRHRLSALAAGRLAA